MLDVALASTSLWRNARKATLKLPPEADAGEKLLLAQAQPFRFLPQLFTTEISISAMVPDCSAREKIRL